MGFLLAVTLPSFRVWTSHEGSLISSSTFPIQPMFTTAFTEPALWVQAVAAAVELHLAKQLGSDPSAAEQLRARETATWFEK
jgi:hypothetical protein